MRHVFVETTWVVSYAAPAHLGMATARELLQPARDDIRLYVPSVCIAEANQTIRRKYQARAEADRVRQYLKWVRGRNMVTEAEDETTRRILDQMENSVRAELDRLDEILGALRGHLGIEVFALSDEMLERTLALSSANLDLKPFDLSILAAVLVRAGQIPNEGNEFMFCCLDTDLQPWDREGRPRRPLIDLYRTARIWVFSDFTMETPPKPEGWPP